MTEDIVARALTYPSERNPKGSIYSGGKQVVFHHPKHKPICMKRKTKKRWITRGVFRALMKTDKGERCERCWSDRQWNMAMKVRKGKTKTIDQEVNIDNDRNMDAGQYRPPDGLFRLDDFW